MADKPIDELSGVETTGHEWDGIRELNNPMPRWWVWTFYATIAWAIGYAIAYPAWPMITGATKGVLGYTSRGELAEAVKIATDAQKVFKDKIAATSIEAIARDPQLLQFALDGGEAAFKVNCITCHGTGAMGGPGYPNLNDDDWLWGGTVDQIYQTIRYGVRSDHEETRTSEMPAFADMIEPGQIREVAAYVVSLTRKPSDQALVEPGRQLFADNCASCHGEKAEGNKDIGAPNLADAIWLKGDTEEAIARQVTAPRHGVMPAWANRLSDTTIKELAVYIHSLGGGQ
ncbi:cytochrome-c oxidase, cbb3-type subunit III [Rhizobium sp.]